MQISKQQSNDGNNFPPHFLPSWLESQIMVFSDTEKWRIIQLFSGPTQFYLPLFSPYAASWK